MSYATVLWIEIDEFDYLVKRYHGRDFTELLEKVFNGLDQLSEQYGLQVIGTIGKTFVACGGLKFCEKNLDPRLLTSYHSVRVIEFACMAQSFIK
jgi:class 3 adenylate cyclase